MSLYLKYRPTTFEGILGNQNTVSILKGFLNKKDIPQVYLFHGEKGHGKTTFARIMTKYLDCSDNIYEINGSNNRGIDTARQIEEQAQFRTLNGKNKAFIIDEIHQATKDMQNSLLKILEDTPKGVYFFLCTTEKNKLLPTIISRSKQIEVENLTGRTIYPYLIDISIKENNEISKKVSRRIAEKCEGDLRTALNILESVIEFQDEEKQLKIIGEDKQEDKTVIDLCQSLLKSTDWVFISKILISLQKQNPESLRKIILAYMGKVLLGNPNLKAALIIEALQNPIYDFSVLTMHLFSVVYNK